MSELTDIVVVFGAALIAAWLARLIHAPAIIGFLCAGIVVGPDGFDLISHQRVHFFAELGLVLLLFSIGLELSLEPLLRMAKRLALAATIQIVVTTAVVTIGLSLAFEMTRTAAVLVGVAVSLSSTAIVLTQLSSRGEVETATGRLVTGILLLQDICVILVMMLLPVFAGADASAAVLAGRVGLAVGALVAVVVAARFIVPPLVRTVFRRGGRELMTLFAVLMACLGAWLADLAGWSWALGACVAGLTLAQTELRHQLHAEIAPFRDALNALFFISIGMLVDLDIALSDPLVFFGGVAILLLAKAALTAGAIGLSGWPLRLALAGGLALCTVSEFGYVLMKESVALDLLPAQILRQFIALAVGTMLIGTVLGAFANPLGSVLARRLRPERGAATRVPGESLNDTGTPAPPGHVVIVGYGVNGRNLATVLRATRIQYTVVEMDHANAGRARQDGGSVIIGDATRVSILEKAGLPTARALVVTVADAQAVRQIVSQVHAFRPELYVLARTRYVAELDTLYRLGAHQVIPEEFETSIEIFAHVLHEFAVPDNVVEQQVTLIRAGRYGMLRGRASDRALRSEWMRVFDAAVTQTCMVLERSPAAGKTMRELDLRSRTGVTIVAITRGGKPTANPPADFRLEIGDVLVLVGTHQELDKAKVALAPRSDPPPSRPEVRDSSA